VEEFITFTDETGVTLTFSGDTVLVFIDETGHELLKDKQYPIFGLGGCLCLARDYRTQICEPWKLVESVFEPSQLPLHASALPKHKMTDMHFSAINSFFTSNAFARFACLVSDQTINSSSYDFFAVAIANLYERIRTIMQWLAFDKVVMLIEASERTEQRLTSHFNQYRLEANGTQIPLHHFFVHKKHNEPGIIVADFIIQTAGSTVFSKGKNKIKSYTDRRDFQNVFCSLNDKLVSFIEIDSIAPSQTANSST
jgi:Protein of unknown function (DUF3800)